LWDFWQEVERGDLVILSANSRRGAVMQVIGDYEFLPRGNALVNDYQHQREAEELAVDPDEIWERAGAGPAEGHSIRWTLIRCLHNVDLPAART
jgi:hypothetical protein